MHRRIYTLELERSLPMFAQQFTIIVESARDIKQKR